MSQGRLVKSGVVGAGLVLGFTLVAAGGANGMAGKGKKPPPPINQVQRENRQKGTRAWSLIQTASNGEIVGYASEVSVLPGQAVHFHVSTTPAGRYQILIYRLGWYGGAGARRVACLPACTRTKQGQARTVPTPDPTTGLVRATWPVTDTYRFPRKAVSGYYLAKLTLRNPGNPGKVSYVPVILRALPSRRSKILVQVPVNTWQAYNAWGGKSLYAFNSTNQIAATHVSFDRPYDPQLYVPIVWEIGLMRFLEQNGYDVSYTTDVDTDLKPREFLRHRLVIASGHGEYWTKAQRDAFEAARDRGINLAFLGADIGDWQIRYEDTRRTIVEYRNAALDPEPDPALKTVRFRNLTPPRPECELLGIGFGGSAAETDRPRAYSINRAALKDRWFKGTGFKASSKLRDAVGYEWDSIQPGCNTPKLKVFFEYQGLDKYGAATTAEAVRYVAPSGARVFSSGSLQWVWALDRSYGHRAAGPNPRLRRFMKNALVALTAKH
jgi:N,N-dimethylformamidase beta subunit-like protein